MHFHEQFLDTAHRPMGGTAWGQGVRVDWQNGPLVFDDEGRADPNGAYVEDIIIIAMERLRFYNETDFGCREYAQAITKLEEAIHWLNSHTDRLVFAEASGNATG